MEWLTTAIQNAIANSAHDALSRVVAGVVGLSHTVALVGGGICIILYVAGYKEGLNKAGILFVCNLMIKYLLG